METKRYIGIDLHRNCFTACLRLENGREYLKEWKLEDMAKFTGKLRPTDQVAVEVTGNTRLFHDAVAPHVERVVAVNPSQFKVITHSVKKTDPNDARNLALYLAKDLLPEVRMKDKTQAQIASLTQTRDTMVKLRTALKNKVNNLCSAHGVNLNKESLGSEKGLRAVLEMQFDLLVNLELKIIVDQIRSLNRSIAELEEPSARKARNWKGTRI
jgi:transposase